MTAVIERFARSMAVTAILMATATTPVSARAPASPAVPTHCRADEQVVYNCPIRGKVVSVCARPGSVSYRFGPPRAPEIEIASNGRDGLLHWSSGVGGGGGQFNNLRFSRERYEYVVFSGSPGSLHDATQPWSGVQVLDGRTDVARLECKGDRARHRLDLDQVFKAVGHDLPEDGDDYGGWY